jgi:hypothetical protein
MLELDNHHRGQLPHELATWFVRSFHPQRRSELKGSARLLVRAAG